MWTNINLDIYQHVSDLPPYLYDTCHNSSQYQLQFLEIGRDFFCKVERFGFIQLQLFKPPRCILSRSSTNLEAQSSKLWWSLWRSSPFNPCPMSNPQFQILRSPARHPLSVIFWSLPTLTLTSPHFASLRKPFPREWNLPSTSNYFLFKCRWEVFAERFDLKFPHKLTQFPN